MEILSYPFMVRALVAGVLISISAALVGVPLVLRKNSMLGDGLSHTAFAAFAVATVLGFAPLLVALPVTILASFLILKLGKTAERRISGDAAVAVLSASSLAVGTMAISLANGVNIDLNSYLFGSVLAVSGTEVIAAGVLAVAVVLVFVFLLPRIFAITFDADFAKSIGVRVGVYDAIFAIICSAVIVLGMRLLGSLLISSLIIFPTLTAMTFAKTFRGTVLVSVLISVLAFVVGLLISFFAATPTGATVVIVNLITFVVARILKAICF